MQDLDEAIALGREAFNLCPQGHSNHSLFLKYTASYFRSRFTQSKELKDMEEMFNLFAQLEHVKQVVSSTDLSAARAWILAAEDFQHPTLLLAYETSLRLLIQHLASLPSLPQHLVILREHTTSLAVDAFSACLRNRSHTHAAELLEQEWGVFWNQLTRLRSPLDEVIASGTAGKKWADEFVRLVSLVRSILKSASAGQHERLYHLNFQLQKVVTNIRELPGHSRFLLPPLFSDLQRTASGGPVVIVNASQYSCDALVVLFDQDPVHITLQITQKGVGDLSTELHTLTVHATRDNVTRGLASFLRKLWDRIVSPIVDVLQTAHPYQSRI